MNGSEFERRLNERGLSFPHYPGLGRVGVVGGYVAARGSGVLSSRYGKIEDQVVALRVVTPTGEVIDTIPVPRHAVGPELTQLFVGSEGTLGVITQVTVRLVPLPAHRRFEAVALPVARGRHRRPAHDDAARPAPRRDPLLRRRGRRGQPLAGRRPAARRRRRRC